MEVKRHDVEVKWRCRVGGVEGTAANSVVGARAGVEKWRAGAVSGCVGSRDVHACSIGHGDVSITCTRRLALGKYFNTRRKRADTSPLLKPKFFSSHALCSSRHIRCPTSSTRMSHQSYESVARVETDKVQTAVIIDYGLACLPAKGRGALVQSEASRSAVASSGGTHEKPQVGLAHGSPAGHTSPRAPPVRASVRPRPPLRPSGHPVRLTGVNSTASTGQAGAPPPAATGLWGDCRRAVVLAGARGGGRGRPSKERRGRAAVCAAWKNPADSPGFLRGTRRVAPREVRRPSPLAPTDLSLPRLVR